MFRPILPRSIHNPLNFSTRSAVSARLFSSSIIVSEKQLTRNQLKNQLKKDNGVKRPMSAYLIYYTSVKDELIANSPAKSQMKILAQTASENWKNLSAEEKVPFEKEAEKQKENYRSVLKEIENQLPPKKPTPAYITFAQDIRESIVNEDPTLTFNEVSKITSEKWQQLDQTEKDKYLNDYKENLKKWESKNKA
ncbi:DNA-binding protein ABF2 NDAI_0H01380 [Naumovozyma dairenensis CBS 421]|uniref:HMG box domain-containing protein n=1 Tax=Naumovozyma dairenensis (strain ATCC 10597 / BCRC 20456 / CBS 421 / NBRC 0211 / NRRL Y-12639) TaxID=1071378 RepID=G0WEV1_NAUDC|nr:hypothetical protein NDAI_0H01380 [Naumovozyma dairenensis CBS 421]CCD26312.1 hypothetical protein NDAI_0H01380 [Naumovozyma dairenensis CBS 421]